MDFQFSDLIVILQEFVLAYEDSLHQVWLHCTNWKYSYGPLLLSNIHSRQINFLSGRIFPVGKSMDEFKVPGKCFIGVGSR